MLYVRRNAALVCFHCFSQFLFWWYIMHPNTARLLQFPLLNSFGRKLVPYGPQCDRFRIDRLDCAVEHSGNWRQELDWTLLREYWPRAFSLADWPLTHFYVRVITTTLQFLEYQIWNMAVARIWHTNWRESFVVYVGFGWLHGLMGYLFASQLVSLDSREGLR